MNILSAKYEGGRLVLETPDIEARRLPFQFKPGNYDLVAQKKKRSLNANSYAWVLLDKLGVKLGIPPAEIYRTLIRDVPGSNTIMPIEDTILEQWRAGWSRSGLGWQTEIWGKSKFPGFTDVICFFGSSSYKTAQMARFIDLIIAECKEQDIETLPPDKLAGLIREWNSN